MENLQIDAELITRLSRWAKMLDVPLSRLVAHLLVMGIERLEQGAENVSALSAEETHGRQETEEWGVCDAR